MLMVTIFSWQQHGDAVLLIDEADVSNSHRALAQVL